MRVWNRIYKIWQSCDAPEIDIIKFDLNNHHTNSVWFDISTGEQPWNQSNPVNKTGSMLLRYVIGKDPEFVAAFKIHAFTLEQKFTKSFVQPLNDGYSKFGEEYSSWWYPYTKTVLPYLNTEKDSFDKNLNEKNIITEAAELWTKISEQWKLVRTPDHMDSDDPLLGQYNELQRESYAKHEYEMYLRLKDKFKNT